MLLLLLTVSGCAAYNPVPNPWAEIERVPTTASRLTSPDVDAPLDVHLQFGLDAYELSEAHADTLDALSKRFNAALDAGEAEFDIGQIRERELAIERRQRIFDWPRIGLTGAAIGVLLGLSR